MVQVDIVQLSSSALRLYDRVDMELQIPHTLFYFSLFTLDFVSQFEMSRARWISICPTK